jgi:phosphatidylethanolamine-binding protein (PEBP) family uncharacterized protein
MASAASASGREWAWEVPTLGHDPDVSQALDLASLPVSAGANAKGVSALTWRLRVARRRGVPNWARAVADLPSSRTSLASKSTYGDELGGGTVKDLTITLTGSRGASTRTPDGLDEGQAAPREGRNGFGTTGYAGPCPPHGRHRYFFRLHALDTELELQPGADRDQLDRALDGHVLETAELLGGYQR